MSEEVEAITSVTEAVKKTSDGNVKISLEKYNELVDKVADQKSTIRSLRERPPVVNRTVVNKTPEVLAQEHKVSGVGFMIVGASMFVAGALRLRAGYRIS